MPKLPRLFVPFVLFFVFATLLGTRAFAQYMTPNSIQVSRVQYDGDAGNVYVSPYSFPEIFNDPAGLSTGNGIQDIEGIQGSIYIDQFNSVPAGPTIGTSLSLPSTGAPATYPTVEPGSYITTSFSSKSEGALTLSVNGDYMTYFGYEAGDQLNDVSNSYSPNPSYQLVPNSYTLDPTLGTPITIAAASDTSKGNATITLSSPVTVPSGAYFTIAGMSITGYNGTWATSAASTGSTTIKLTGLPGSLVSCTSAATCGGTATYDPPYPFYDREVALINSSGLVSLTPIDNADSGDNPRAALTVDGNEFYTAGNSDSTEYSGSPTTGPGLTIGVRCGIPEQNLSYQLGTYVAADRPDESAKKHVKDNNWRGIGIYTDGNGNQQLYVSKGSGGNGDDGVFQVQDPTTLILPVCTEGGTDTSANFNILFSAQATVPGGASYQTSPYLPFGFWFANPTTLYVADEGNPPSYLGGSSPSFQNSTNGTFTLPQLANGSYASDPYAGLEKWSLVDGTWQYDYTIQAGLNLYQPVTANGYNDVSGDPLVSYTYGIRNMTGYNNGDGTATIYAITSQFSAVSGGEPDPTSLVGITDQISATTLPANEQFITLQTSAPGEVFRGVAYVPPSPGSTRLPQTINFPTVGPLAYGAAPVTLSATATSGWPIAYTLVSGPATLSGNVLTVTGVGSVIVQADQSGNTDYSAAPSVQQTITVNPAATSINVSVSPSSEEYGVDGTITITATMSWSGSGVAPTASNIIIGGTGPSGYSATSCGAPVSNTITCTATYTPTPADAAGYYTELATFTGDSNYSGSTSPQTNNFSIYDANSITSVVLTSGTNPSTYGQSQTFTATITSDTGQVVGAFKGSNPGRHNGGANPLFVNGTVTWSSNTGCAPSTVSGYPGTATCTTSILPPGSDTVTATYGSDSSHNGSQGSVSQTVNQAATSISVSVSPASEAYGQDAPVTITAVLSWSGNGAAPTAANVTISGNGTSSYGPTSCGAPSSNIITCTATYTPTTADGAGTYTETATFSGDANYTSSSSSQTSNFTITDASSIVSVSSSLNPSTYGQSVTFTATINGEFGQVKRGKGNIKPQVVSGTVTWSSNTGCGTTPVSSGNPGTATCTVPNFNAGSYTITAQYSGDSNHSGSTGTLSGGQTVNQASQTITFTTSPPASAVYNTSFTVAATGGASGNPVTFSASGSCSGSGTSSATYTMTSGTGTCSVTVNQAGNSNYSAAPQVTKSVKAKLATQTITATPPAEAIEGGSFTVSASASSGLPLTFASSGDCTNSGATYTMGSTGGTCAGTIIQSGNNDYAPAPSFTWITTVITSLVKPTVSLTGAPTTAVGGSSFTVTATYPNTQGVPPVVPTITGTGACSAGAVTGSNPYYATITMTAGTGTCTTTAAWAANFYYAAASVKEKTKAALTTPTVTFTGAPTTAADNTQFTVTATSNETGAYASIPTITASGSCSAGAVSNSGPGSYQATITINRSSGMCKMTAAWAETIEYDGATLKQTTTAQ